MKRISKLGQVILTVLFILSLSLQGIEPADAQDGGGVTIKRHAQTGKVSFLATAPGHPIDVPGAHDRALSQVERALAMLQPYAADFGLRQANKELMIKKTDAAQGRQVTRFQQTYQDIPVMAGELVVNATDQGELLSINGEIAPDLSLDTKPSISAAQARSTALQALAKWRGAERADFQASDPELWIYDARLLEPDGTRPMLVWRMEVSSKQAGELLDELVLVDAQRGGIILHFSQVDSILPLQVTDPPPTEAPSEPPAEPPAETPGTEALAEPVSAPGVIEPLSGDTHYVRTNGSDTGTCTNANSPCLTINYAIGQTSAGDTVKVAAGTYTGTGSDPVVTIDRPITLSGDWNSSFTAQDGTSTIDGQGARIGINHRATEAVTISHFTVQNGMTTWVGAGILGEGWSGPLTVEDCVVHANVAAVNGGGVYGSQLTVTRCSIFDNSAASGDGGGFYSEARGVVNNSSIYGNQAGSDGGGVFVAGDSSAINNSTIVDNDAPNAGGIYGMAASPYALAVNNSIVSGNTAPNCAGVGNADHNLLGTGCTFTSGEGNINGNPQLSSLPVGHPPYFLPLPGSPVIDAGNSATCLETDQRGVSRPVGPACDIGAVENAPAYVIAMSGSGQRVPFNTTLPLPLVALVADAEGDPIPDATVTFTAPSSGPSGSFAGGGRSTTATTNSQGMATSSLFTTNSTAGTFNIVATASGVAATAKFSVTIIGTWLVAPVGNDSWDCLTAATVCKTINAAVGKAAPGDTIYVAAGTYGGTGSDPVVNISKGISIQGGWNGDFTSRSGTTIIDGQGGRQGIAVTAATSTVTLSHLTIQNGYASDAGGGVYAPGNASLVVENCTIRDNMARGQGGGIYANTLIITGSHVHHNQVKGITSYDTRLGGGISAGTLTMNSTAVSYNSVTGPSDAYAGGVFIAPGQALVNNSTIYNNSAKSSGGGIMPNQGGMINNSTIVGNHSDESGAALYSPWGLTTLRNTIITGNTAPGEPISCRGTYYTGDLAGDHNLVDTGCPFTSGEGNITGNPQLFGLPIGMPPFYPLQPGSPAIDAGNLETCPETDQRGAGRPYGSSCDIGAFEYTGPGTIPANILLYDGDGQFLDLGGTAPVHLKVMVLDSQSSAVPGVTVTFTAPTAGATVTFSNGLHTIDVLTNDAGIADAGVMNASSSVGSYTVQATFGALPAATFHLLNVGADLKIYTMNHNTASQAPLPGWFVCDLSDADCGETDANAAQDYGSGTYAFYFGHFGRNSLDGAGMPIIISVHYGYYLDNAVWWAGQAVFGDGWPQADDVVAHELTHGLTEHESDLYYYYQSGAIGESLSDIFGELYDQSNGLGNDDADKRWLIGEDLPSHPDGVRRMDDPPAHEYPGPDRISSPYYDFDLDESDGGGIHANAGINNKAAYLLVEGGSFNGKNITALGADKTLAIYYEVNRNLLTSGSDYGDLYYALPQACHNLAGGPAGIVMDDCLEVQDAVDAAEMNFQLGPTYNTEAPACDIAGSLPHNILFDGFEAGAGNWLTNSPRWTINSPYGSYARSGLHFMFADDYPDQVADAQLMMKTGIAIPPNAYLRFSHAYEFERYLGYSDWYDGGVLEYRANNGAWTDARSLMQYNGYDGQILGGSGNPLAGRWAFTGISHGYISTRLNLSSLAGKSVQFRWRMGLDEAAYSMGWWLDDVHFYTCPGLSPFAKSGPQNDAVEVSLNPTIAWSASQNATYYEYCYDLFDDDRCNDGWSGRTASRSAVLSHLGSDTTYYWQVRASNASGAILADSGTWHHFRTSTTPPPGVSGVKVIIGPQQYGSYSLSSGESVRPSYAGVDTGPVKVFSSDGTPIIASLRVNMKRNSTYSSYTEFMGIPASQLSDTYLFPWYNNATFGGVQSQIRFGNVGTQPTTVTVKIGGVVQDTYDLAPNASQRVTYNNLDAGPVEVHSSGNVPIIASMRINLKTMAAFSSYSEFMGLTASATPGTKYMFPWYNNATAGGVQSQIRFGNVGTQPTTVTVKIGGVVQDTYDLAANQSQRVTYSNIDAGPVEVYSSGNVPVIASMRVNLKTMPGYSSYSELIGQPGAVLTDTKYVFPWYNNATAGGVQSQLRFANVGTQPTTVTVKIGGQMQDTYDLAPNASQRVTYSNIDAGPVEVYSSGNVPIIASMRVNLKTMPGYSSYSELMGLSVGAPLGWPGDQLSSTYWFPWYSNATAGGVQSQLRFGVP